MYRVKENNSQGKIINCEEPIEEEYAMYRVKDNNSQGEISANKISINFVCLCMYVSVFIADIEVIPILNELSSMMYENAS